MQLPTFAAAKLLDPAACKPAIACQSVLPHDNTCAAFHASCCCMTLLIRRGGRHPRVPALPQQRRVPPSDVPGGVPLGRGTFTSVVRKTAVKAMAGGHVLLAICRNSSRDRCSTLRGHTPGCGATHARHSPCTCTQGLAAAVERRGGKIYEGTKAWSVGECSVPSAFTTCVPLHELLPRALKGGQTGSSIAIWRVAWLEMQRPCHSNLLAAFYSHAESDHVETDTKLTIKCDATGAHSCRCHWWHVLASSGEQ